IPARRISVKRSIVLEVAARSRRQRDLGLLDVDIFADRLDLSVRELEDEAIFVLVRLTRDRRATVDELDDHRVALAVRFVDLGFYFLVRMEARRTALPRAAAFVLPVDIS